MKLFAVVATLMIAPAAARADESDHEMFISMGGSFAYTVHEDAANGGSLGGEISVGKYWFPEHDDDKSFNLHIDPYWAGVYVDFLHDTAIDKTRISVGPEVGKNFLGLDAGLLVQTGDDARVGISVRPAITLAFASLTVRYGHYFDGKPDASLWEVGMLVKLPVPF
jgi:hypothetical protein